MEILLTIGGLLLGLLAFSVLLALALALVLMLAPVSYKFDGHFAEETAVRAKLRWLFFGVTFKDRQLKAGLLFFDVTKFFMPKPGAQEAPEHTRRDRFKDFWRIRHKVNVKKIGALSILLIKRLARVTRPKRFRAEGIVGFGCPAKTGQFLGLYEAAAAIFNLRGKVMLQGSFGEERLDLKVDFAGRFMPVCVIIPVLRFIFAPEVQAFMEIRKGMRA